MGKESKHFLKNYTTRGIYKGVYIPLCFCLLPLLASRSLLGQGMRECVYYFLVQQSGVVSPAK